MGDNFRQPKIDFAASGGERMKRSNEITLGEAIRQFIETYRFADKLRHTQLIDSWETIVGTMIARHTTRLYIKQRTLYVVLDSPVIRNELLYARNKLVKLLNKEAGGQVIDEIVLL